MSTPTAHTHNAKAATVTFSPHSQNLNNVQAVVADIVRRAGCDGCGRLAFLEFRFHGDPVSPEQQKAGVVAIGLQGF